MSYLTNPHDHFFKELFSRPEVAADFMAHYLPPEIAAALDLNSLELVKDSFVDDALREFEPEFHYYLCDLSSYDVSQIKGIAILQAGLRLMRTIFTGEFEETLEEVFDLNLRD